MAKNTKYEERSIWFDEQASARFPQRDAREEQRPLRSRRQGVHSRFWTERISAVRWGNAFKSCCLKNGRFDGPRPNYYGRD